MQSTLFPFENPSNKENLKSGLILSFDKHKKRQKNIQTCIFCGTTSPLQNFKGKTVCYDCLHSIPGLFSYNSNYVT